MLCEYCNSEFLSKASLNNHKKRAKYCLKIQNHTLEIVEFKKFKCGICDKYFSNKSNLNCHIKTCYENLYKINEYIVEKNQKIKDHEIEIFSFKTRFDEKVGYEKSVHFLFFKNFKLSLV